jgi:hypothetical protein
MLKPLDEAKRRPSQFDFPQIRDGNESETKADCSDGERFSGCAVVGSAESLPAMRLEPSQPQASAGRLRYCDTE